jgi:hypothetical protein
MPDKKQYEAALKCFCCSSSSMIAVRGPSLAQTTDPIFQFVMGPTLEAKVTLNLGTRAQ